MGIPKLDSAAIPDFNGGAMENWGLVKYRERALLFDENESSLNYKQSIASIITHEQAHLWFGDIVTCDWWSYAWLNEGFAEYFQYMATAALDPSLEFDKQYVVSGMQSVLVMDSTNQTNPMSNINVNTPSMLDTSFNSITYTKGSAIIRMVRNVLGEANFQQSLQTYIRKHQYQTTQPENLFDVWTDYFPTQFRPFAADLFDSFTWQVGYPLITVNVADNRRSFQVNQKRFLLDPTDGSDSTLLYTVPFTYTTNVVTDFSNTAPAFFLPPASTTTVVALNQSISWIIANIQEVGYYRVNYDNKTWNRINTALRSKNWGSIHELNRAQIIDDLFNLARADEIPYGLALNIVEYLSTETNYLPWLAAVNGFMFLSKRLGANIADFSAFILRLTNNIFTSLGFVENSNDQPLTILLRSLSIQWACRYVSTSCITTAQSYFNNMATTPVPANIRQPVYCVAMREGTASHFDQLVAIYRTSTVATELSLIVGALGCVKDTTLIERYFEIILTDEIRYHDKSNALSSLTSYNNENVTPVFRLITANSARLANALGGYLAVASSISNIAERFTTEDQLLELQAFNNRAGSEFGGSVNTLIAAEQKVRKNLAWSAIRLGSVNAYLEPAKGNSEKALSYSLLPLVIMSLFAKLLI